MNKILDGLNEAQRVAIALVASLLRFARRAPVITAPFDLAAMTQDVVRMLSEMLDRRIAFDAAIAPTAVRSTRAELSQLPYLDAGYFILAGNHHYLLEAVGRGDQAAATRFLGWLLRRCRDRRRA